MGMSRERIETLCVPDNFQVAIAYSGPSNFKEDERGWGELSKAEYDRLALKLALVEKVAARLAANMLKGTLKYDDDEYTLREWLEMGIDDGLDTVNYLALGLEKLGQLEERMGGSVENSDLFAMAKRSDGSGA